MEKVTQEETFERWLVLFNPLNQKAGVFIQKLCSIIIKYKAKPVDIEGKMHLDFQQMMMEFF